tara:strand:- start:341 stop:529 length:189 start_codon:yes stop_codon:yes gene_type:complete
MTPPKAFIPMVYLSSPLEKKSVEIVPFLNEHKKITVDVKQVNKYSLYFITIFLKLKILNQNQ